MANHNAIPPENGFKPGVSGNPNGRPKKLPELDKLLANVLGEEKDGVTAAETILKALRVKATKGDIRAAEVLLDRGYGKAKQTIENEGQMEIIVRYATKGNNTSGATHESGQDTEGAQTL
jgi:hypothetical protein